MFELLLACTAHPCLFAWTSSSRPSCMEIFPDNSFPSLVYLDEIFLHDHRKHRPDKMEESQDGNVKNASSVTFWHALADMLSACYPQAQQYSLLRDCQGQPARMLPVLLIQTGFSLLSSSLSSITSQISGSTKTPSFTFFMTIIT